MASLKLKSDAEAFRPQRLQRVDTPRTLRVKKELDRSPYLPILDRMPPFLRYGPWSPTAYIFLILFLIAMMYQSQTAYNLIPDQSSTHTNDKHIWNGIWRLLLSVYGVGIAVHLYKRFSYWPLVSFTVMSWNLFTLRYLFTSMISFGFTDSYILYFMSEMLRSNSIYTIIMCYKYYITNTQSMLYVTHCNCVRFPALVCNSITVSVWWIVLVPSILFMIKSKSAQKAFIKFNIEPMLINLHLLNIVFAGLDHMTNPRALNFFDLYMGVFVGGLYILVYLFILDPMGLHFYHVILSPRPHWCTIPYIIALCLFPLYMWMWNWITLRL